MSTTWKLVVVLLAGGLVTEAVLLVAVMRQMGSVLLQLGPMRPEALPVGPKVGETKELPGQTGRPALVLFTSGCTICESMLPGFRAVRRDYANQLELFAVVTHKDPRERADYARRLGDFARTDLLGLMQDWEIPGTPYAVALDEDGVVRGAGVINSID